MSFFSSLLPPPLSSTLFPYTTLFRSVRWMIERQTGSSSQKQWGHLTRPAELAVQMPPLLRSEEHTSELQSRGHLVCRLLLEKKKKKNTTKPVGPATPEAAAGGPGTRH